MKKHASRVITQWGGLYEPEETLKQWIHKMEVRVESLERYLKVLYLSQPPQVHVKRTK